MISLKYFDKSRSIAEGLLFFVCGMKGAVMMSIQKLVLFFVVFGVFGAGCVTSRPDKVPELDLSALPKLAFRKLTPRKVSLLVKNARSINQTAGNSAAVEAAVTAAVADSLKRGEVEIGDGKNQLLIEIHDCKDESEGGQCVSLKGTIKTARHSVSLESSFTHGVTREGSKYVLYGEISDAYQGALKQLLKGLEARLDEVE